MPRAEYEKFIADRAAHPSSVALGKEEFEDVCSVCHRLDEHATSARRSAATRCSTAPRPARDPVRNGVGKMPAVGSDWSDDQIDALFAYTKELRRGRSG